MECKCCHGDQEIANVAVRMGYRPDIAFARIKKLEDRLFQLGEMNRQPCFVCGYNGEGYYQPDKHPCAERHLRLMWRG